MLSSIKTFSLFLMKRSYNLKRLTMSSFSNVWGKVSRVPWSRPKVGSGLIWKYQSRQERLARDKCYRLFGLLISDTIFLPVLTSDGNAIKTFSLFLMKRSYNLKHLPLTSFSNVWSKVGRVPWSRPKVCSGLTKKYQTRQERLIRNKCFSLFGLLIIDTENNVC